MLFCGICGKEMKCVKTGAIIHFSVTDSRRHCDVYGCRTCRVLVLSGFGGWYRGNETMADVEIGKSTIRYLKEEFM